MENKKLIRIIDKYLPAEGVGTEREKQRMAMYNDLVEFFNDRNREIKRRIIDLVATIHE